MRCEQRAIDLVQRIDRAHGDAAPPPVGASGCGGRCTRRSRLRRPPEELHASHRRATAVRPNGASRRWPPIPQRQGAPREAPLQVAKFGREIVREVARRHLAAALHVEVVRRVAALLLVARDVVRGEAGGAGARACRVRARRPGRRRACGRSPGSAWSPAPARATARSCRCRHRPAPCPLRAMAARGLASSPPFHQTTARQSASGGCTSASRRANSGGEHRLGAGQLADVAGFHQQAAHQAPQGQRRHVAGPAVQQQVGAEGAHGTALHGRLEFVEHLGVGEVLGDEAMQLRRAKALEVTVEARRTISAS